MGNLIFTSPFLLAGLLALPVLWWVLRALPPTPRRVSFGGFFFLKDVENRRETPARTPWWILVIRLAAIASLILGLSGPVINASTELDGKDPLLMIVDDSWPAASRWRERQENLEQMGSSPGAAARPTFLLTTAGDPRLYAPGTLAQSVRQLKSLTPKAALPNRNDVLSLMEEISVKIDDIVWVSDGVIGRKGVDREFLRKLEKAGKLTVIRPSGQSVLSIRNFESRRDSMVATIERIGTTIREGTLIAAGADGRQLAQIPFQFADGENRVEVEFSLPLLLRNDVRRLTISGIRSAGSTWLVDSRNQRVRVGLVTESSGGLMAGGFYLEQALAERAVIVRGELDNLVSEDVSMLILDDIGVIRPSIEQDLIEWLRLGGTLVRFAGPATANAATATETSRAMTFPVALRGNDRTLGGTLSWSEPQHIAAFPSNSPFAGIDISAPVTVLRQVLTRATTEPGYEVWATLEDGTPLVTARKIESGVIILFHVTATPGWSDLPLSGAFPQMLDTITEQAAKVPVPASEEALAPWRLLDGFGQLTDPGTQSAVATPEELASGEASPGLYGSASSALSVNTYTENAPTLDPLGVSLLPPNAAIRGLEGATTRALGPPLILIALILIAIDALELLARHRREMTHSAAILLVGFMSFSHLPGAFAQSTVDLRPDLDPNAIASALSVRFAYVETGDPGTDRLVRSGLAGLTREATRRSALEPAPPVGVDIERDDLSVYPLIYWAIHPGMTLPSDGALSQLETFMGDGGMLVIDTMDGERQAGALETPEGALLRRILLRMNIPPLEPLPADHILKKSFYRLDDLEGRNGGGPVWVEAPTALRETTDGVPSLIIGGRDWASAWATDADGRALRTPGQGGELRREYAYRSGINMAMVALTGNYKQDQVHVQELLDSLGAPQ